MPGTLIIVITWLIIALVLASKIGFWAKISSTCLGFALAYSIIYFLEKKDKESRLDEKFEGFSSEALSEQDLYLSRLERFVSEVALKRARSRKEKGPWIADENDMDDAFKQVILEIAEVLRNEGDRAPKADPLGLIAEAMNKYENPDKKTH